MEPDVVKRAPDRYLKMFTRYLKGQGLRLTHQRDTIVEVFLRTSGHVTLDDLYLSVMKVDKRIGQSTLYRTMKLLVASGLAHAHHFSDAPTRYEVAIEGQHHDHLICLGCGKILEFENPAIEKLQDEVAESFGFRIHYHRMELYGECRECALLGEG
jgi:Fur family transcriptional regulator, ferric uptake regulator